MTVGYITLGQRRARADVQALARTALTVCDILAREAGYEPSEAPRNYLLTVERWCSGDGAAEERHLSAVTASLRTWRTGVSQRGLDEPTFVRRWGRALVLLFDARRDFTEHPTHTFHVRRVTDALAEVLESVRVMPLGSQRADVEAFYKQRRLDVARSAAQVTRAIQASRRRIDKAEAERLMGTLPGMETR